MCEERLPVCYAHLISFGQQHPGFSNRRVLQEKHGSSHFLLPRQLEPLLCLLPIILNESHPSTKRIGRHEVIHIVLLPHRFEQCTYDLLSLDVQPLSLIGQGQATHCILHYPKVCLVLVSNHG